MKVVTDKRSLNFITEELKTIVVEQCSGYFLAKGQAEGQVRGQAEGKAQALLTVLAARGVEVGDEIRQQVLGCLDESLLDRWLTRAAMASSTTDVLTDSPLPPPQGL